MNILKVLTGNDSLQKMLIDKLVNMGKEQGFSKLIVDLKTADGKPGITEIKETDILVDAETFEFYKQFYETNKNLINE